MRAAGARDITLDLDRRHVTRLLQVTGLQGVLPVREFDDEADAGAR